MTLRLRGSSQIDDASIELSKLSNIDHGTILGRTSEGSGAPEALTSTEVRNELGLSTSDNVEFGTLSSTNITIGDGNSLDVSSGTLTLADDQISGDKISGGDISGDLTLSGSTVDVSNNLSAGSISSSAATLSGGSIDAMTIGSNSQSTAKVTTIQATGNADLDGDLDVAGTTTVVALTSSGLINAQSLHSDSVDIDGGAIDGTVIGGNTPATATFSSLESSGNLIVGGNLTVENNTTIESTSLIIEDSIIQIGKDNSEDLHDLGIIGKYTLPSGGNSVISNNNFDSSVDWSSTDWVNVSSSGSGGYYISYQYAAKNIYFYSKGGYVTSGAMIYQDIELSVDTSGDKSYRFEIEIKVANSHSSTYADLSFWERSETPAPNNYDNCYDFDRRWISTIPGTEPVPGDQWNRRYSPDFETWSSNTITPSSDLSDGFRIAIRVGNSNSPSSAVSVGAMTIDGPVKLYEIDNTTGTETEVTQPVTMNTGIVRDASDEKFKLFQTPEDLSSAATVDTGYITTSGTPYSKSTLVSTIEGNITFDNARTFSLSGDLSGSQTFDGSGNCGIAATIQSDSVEFSMLGCEIDEDDMNSNSASHIPTQQSVKAYVDSQVSTGGFSGISAKDMLMVDSSGVFIAIHEEYQFFNISSSDADNNYVDLNVEVDSEFDELSCVYLNGQKLRFGQSNDYYFGNDASSDFKRMNVNSDILEDGDRLEIRFLIKS